MSDSVTTSFQDSFWNKLFIRTTLHPVTVNTRIIASLVGNLYKPSFVTDILGGGVDRSYSQSVTTQLATVHSWPCQAGSGW